MDIVLLIIHFLFVIHLINEYLGHENKFTEKGWWHVKQNSLRYMDIDEIILRNIFLNVKFMKVFTSIFHYQSFHDITNKYFFKCPRCL